MSMRIALIMLVAVGAAWAQQKSPIILDRANSLQAVEENGVRKQVLTGNVKITRDSLWVICDNAEYFPDSGIVVFRDNVEFHDPQRTMLADEVIYNEFTEEVFASNHVRVYQTDSLSASSRTARYEDRLKHGFLYDDVRLREESRRIILTGRLGYVDYEENFGWVTGNPVLVERDSLQRMMTEIHGDTVFYDDRNKFSRALGHVTVERDSLTSHGDKLEYYTQKKFAELTGQPYANRGMDEMTGDTLQLYFKGEQLDRVEVLGHAVVTSPADSGFKEPENRMEGSRMTLWIDSTAVSEILVQGSAIATYYIRDQGQPKGLNVTSGDRLHVYFEGRKMARIRVEGGTEGDYTPQRLVSRTP
jgi:lipopolysaccharide export system protein LptA